MSEAIAFPPTFAGLVIGPPGDDGQCVVKDPRRGEYFSLGVQEAFLLEQLQGGRTAASICAAFEARFAEPLSEGDLSEFLGVARKQGLLQPAGAAATANGQEAARPAAAAAGPGVAEPAPRRPRQNLLAWRVRLIDPDRLLTWLEPKLRWVWTGPFMALSAGAILVAFAVVWANRQELITPISQLLHWETLAMISVTMMLVIVCHEFAHGLTCKHYGGEVHDMGFLMLLFMPCLYCNVSDSWLFRDRWKRIAVMLAGSYCELLIWAAAVFVWRLALPGTLHYQLGWTLASVTGTRVAFNFNPLMKLDGYYILSDLVAVPNLRQRSQDAMTGHLRRVLWGAPRPGRIPKGRMLVAFGIATWLFSLAVLALILVGLTRSLNGPWGPVGLVVVIPLMVGILRSLFVGFSAGELTEMVRRRRERTAVWASILALLPPMATVGEVEDWAGGSFALRSRSQAEIRAPVGGFLRDLDREEGDSVSPGEVIARIEVPDLDNRLKQARASVRESRAKLRLLEVGPRPEEVREQRRRVERAKAWRDLARRDLSRAEQAFQADLERLGSQMAQARAETDYTESVLARNKKLQGRGAVSAEQIVEADAKHRIAKAQTEQAKAQRQARQAEGTLEAEAELARRESELAEAGAALALLEAGTRPEEIEAEQARLARLEAEVLYLEGVQVKTRVTSPVAGRLTTPHLRELVGHYYQEGELIGEVKSPSALEAEIRMTEQDSARIRPGQRIELKIRALPFKKVYARVDRIAPVAAPPPSSRESPVPPGEMPSSVTISCRLEDPPAVLRPGMTGYAHVARGRRPIGEIAAERAVRLLRTEYWW